jgi:hypothetical protein
LQALLASPIFNEDRGVERLFAYLPDEEKQALLDGRTGSAPQAAGLPLHHHGGHRDPDQGCLTGTETKATIQ